MIIYIYDENTGEFLYEYSPQPNPLTKGEFLTPPNSTTIRPIPKDGFVNVFSKGKWVYIPDFRNQEIINPQTLEKFTMNEIGDLPEGFVLYSEYIVTDEFLANVQKMEKLKVQQEILDNIEDLDKKRIRAICEPEMREDGTTWLEFYTSQIIDLRQQLQEVKNGTIY